MVKRPPLIHLSQLLRTCMNDPALPRTFVSEQLPTLLHKFELLEIQARADLYKLFTCCKLNRNDVLQLENKEVEYLWLIEKGIVHSVTTANNREIICQFHFSGEFVGSLSCFQMERKSLHTLKAYTKLVCWSVPCNEFAYMCERYPVAREIVQILQNSKLQWDSDLYHRIRTLTPDQHYRYIQNNFPQYLRLLSSKCIASFMNIAPETLYRLKN